MKNRHDPPRRLLENLVLVRHPAAADGAAGLLNAYLVLLSDSSVLVDAPFAPAVAVAREIADKGHPPIAHVVTDAGVLAAGDAFAEIERLFGISTVFAPAPAEVEAGRLPPGAERTVRPEGDRFLARAGIVPVRASADPAAPTLYAWTSHGGVLFAGTTLVEPSPEAGQETAPARLVRGASDAAACIGEEDWRAFLADRPVRSILPLVGRPIVDVPDVKLRLPFLVPPDAD